MIHQIHIFLKGLIIGLFIAIPVGPIGVLCIRRTLTQGRMAGFLSGLGASTADALYGAIAGFGLTFLSNFLIHQWLWLRLVGGGLLCILGTKTFLSKPAKPGVPVEGNNLWNAYLSIFFLTLTNPIIFFFFAGIFAGLGIVSPSNRYVSAGILVLGLFIGSSIWWVILSGFTSLLHGLFNFKRLQWLNRIAGLIIIGFGIVAFLYKL
jgi:threonine/homoserine/homoserine lactone efflux protein